MLKIVGNTESYGQILTGEAIQFLELLCRKFQGDIEQLLLIARVGSVIMMMENFPIFSVKRRKFEAETGK